MSEDQGSMLQQLLSAQPPEVREHHADRMAARRGFNPEDIRNFSIYVRDSTSPGSEERRMCETKLRDMQTNDAPSTNGIER